MSHESIKALDLLKEERHSASTSSEAIKILVEWVKTLIYNFLQTM
jgi:hypothetical protein